MMPYIINVALILAGCLAFYKILLQKETFYRLNRYVLIGCLFISFSLPLLTVPEQFSFRKKANQTSLVTAPKNELVSNQESVAPPSTPGLSSPQPDAARLQPESPATDSFSFQQIMNWMLWLYWFGVIAFGLNFILQLIILLYKSRRHPVIIDGKFRIVEVSGDNAPCSFGNSIFINPEKYEWDTYNQILLHEKVHIRQKHTLDILLAELVLVFQWFNPFAWIYRREMENNLEFLTDDQLTQKEKLEPQSYQLSLLKVSAPHFPLSLTTNYNQSILKKRIAMMNIKRSNLHTAWKYFFLLPVLALFACLLNEPRAQSSPSKNKEKQVSSNEFQNEGYWFAIIKDDKVNIRFSDEQITSDDNDYHKGHSNHSTTFKLSELGTLPMGSQGSFKIAREAGTMELTGRFENNTGMGRYKFTPDQAYVNYMNKELGESLEEDEPVTFFFLDIKKEYLQMLKSQGFTKVTKEDIIPMAALKVDAAFIKSIKDAGFNDVGMEELVPLKAMNINKAYIDEIRSAGIKNIDLDKLISFKAQGIDKEYISKVKNSGLLGKDGEDDEDAIVTMKSMDITSEFANQFKDLGYTNLSGDQLVTMKSLGITPEYMKSFESIGYKNIDLEDFNSLKALNVTPEFIKGFEAIGYKNIPIDDLMGLKALGVTPEYIKTMKEKGFNYEKLNRYIQLKALTEEK